MKFMKLIMLTLSVVLVFAVQAQEELPPYYGITVETGMDELKSEIQTIIGDAGFEVVGSYNVAGKSNLWVVAFTNDDLKNLCNNFEDRGALASVMKVGLFEKDGKVEISLLNPQYMFYAYFGDDYNKYAEELNNFDQQVEDMMFSKFGKMQGFGGGLSPEELMKYHYKIMMPYFNDPVELEAYSNFDEGLEFIRKKIVASGNDMELVYEVVDMSKKTAVFGIGLLSAEEGEPHFLPIIGERHIAAMPYEIILQNNEVTMLAGKYRFALYWPELTMGEFMKIMSTPGDVEDAMISVTEKE